MKKVAIEKDNDLLSREEIQKHIGDVMTAVYDEHKTWISHDCFRRHPRRNAVNILDVKWVLKWKWMQVRGKNGEIKQIRIIRARLTQRGFRDLDKGHLQTFSGTASRLAQRVDCF